MKKYDFKDNSIVNMVLTSMLIGIGVLSGYMVGLDMHPLKHVSYPSLISVSHARASDGNLDNWIEYQNQEYGFAFMYPQDLCGDVEFIETEYGPSISSFDEGCPLEDVAFIPADPLLGSEYAGLAVYNAAQFDAKKNFINWQDEPGYYQQESITCELCVIGLGNIGVHFQTTNEAYPFVYVTGEESTDIQEIVMSYKRLEADTSVSNTEL